MGVVVSQTAAQNAMPSTIDEPLDLAHFIAEEDVQAEIVEPGAQMPTVNAAAVAMRVAPEQIFMRVR